MEKKYRYYCPTCEKNFIESTKVSVCSNCGNKFIHIYEWQEAGRTDFFMMRFLLVKSIIRRMLEKIRSFRVSAKQTVTKPIPVAKPIFRFRRPVIRSSREELPSR